MLLLDPWHKERGKQVVVFEDEMVEDEIVLLVARWTLMAGSGGGLGWPEPFQGVRKGALVVIWRDLLTEVDGRVDPLIRPPQASPQTTR